MITSFFTSYYSYLWSVRFFDVVGDIFVMKKSHSDWFVLWRKNNLCSTEFLGAKENYSIEC